jgi:hypothetical protein
MIGIGKLRALTTDIDGPGVPNVGQRRFDEVLYAVCQCRLAWNSRRQVFVVYRDRGKLAWISRVSTGR